jgi:hypothetical protein
MLRLFEDGAFRTSGPRGETRGRYRLDGNGKLLMEFSGRSAEIAVSVSDNQLLFCQEYYRCDEFQRVEP